MDSVEIEIDPDRLLADLHRVADFGRYKTGVHRPTFSEADVKSRHWLAETMLAADLKPTIDGVGNVIGKTTSRGPRLLVGSHSESQNYAGWLDGILGVVYGIETARAIKEAGLQDKFGIDVGAWADEECHFLQFLGSRSYIDDLLEEEIDHAKNKDDRTPLRDALRRAGFADRPRERMEADRYIGYLEAHIEQGDSLDRTGLQIGIVTSIVGLWQYRVSFFGQQNHAGTTSMVSRKDAGNTLVKLAAMIADRFPSIARERSVWTIGRIELDPGAPSIIPGAAHMLFQFRDDEVSQLEKFEAELNDMVHQLQSEGPCRCEVHVVDKAMPNRMHPPFQSALERAAERHCPRRHIRMPSGAAHDAQVFAKRLPSAMMFVPSINGISHHYDEDTKEVDIINGCRVFASAVATILSDACKQHAADQSDRAEHLVSVAAAAGASSRS